MKKFEKYFHYLKGYRYYLKSLFYSENTILKYTDSADEFLTFLKNEKKYSLKYLDKKDIEKYLSTLFLENTSISTINIKISAINNFFTYLRQKYNYNNLPKVQNLKNNKNEKKIVSEEVLLNFLKSKGSRCKNKNWIFCRNFSIGYLIYSTGMRISEVIYMEPNFLYKKYWIFVKNGKNGKQRIIPVNKKAIYYIELYQSKCPYKFYKYLWLSQNGTKLSKAAAQNGVKNIFGVYPHYLRHAFATHLYRNNCDLIVLKEILGHSSINTTSLYIYRDEKDLKETVKKLPLFDIT